jgi:multidrug efflux system outer membrane protein
MKRSFILLTSLIALVSCAVGPDYKRPVVDIPPDWRWKKAEPRDDQSKGPWWEMYNDVTLNELEERAIISNQELKAAVARVEQSRAIARISEADFFPDLSTNPSWTRSRSSGNSGGLSQSRTSNQFSVPFDLTYEVDLWGKVRRGFESAQNEFLASAADYQNILFSLQANVATTYFQLRSTEREIKILEEALKIRSRSVEIFKARAESGYGSDLDLTRAQGEYSTAEGDLSDAKNRRAQYQNALAVLIGKPTSNFEISMEDIDFSPPVVSAGLPSELLERRPDVAQAERLLAARNAEIGIAYAAFFPSLRLTAGAGVQSVDLKDLFEWESRVWSFSPSVSLPIFSGGRYSADLKRARAAYDEAVAIYRQSVLVAFQEVDDTLAATQFLDAQAHSLDDAVASSRKASELSTARFTNGLVDYLDVIDAERSRLQNELLAVRVDTQRMLNSVLLVKAIGGGWSTYSANNQEKRP